MQLQRLPIYRSVDSNSLSSSRTTDAHCSTIILCFSLVYRRRCLLCSTHLLAGGGTNTTLGAKLLHQSHAADWPATPALCGANWCVV